MISVYTVSWRKIDSARAYETVVGD
jgi:hypothetical protein